mgnify:CR=1 FL=1
MEYIIYCDESVSDGKYYTDFFGGVLVRNTDFDKIREALDTKKQEINLKGEIKWVKVTENYLEKYKQMMDLFFSFIKENLFQHILELIQESDGIDFFDISKTTPIAIPKDFWTMPYRHWKFTTPEFRRGGESI